jgi:hypothetical protein
MHCSECGSQLLSTTLFDRIQGVKDVLGEKLFPKVGRDVVEEWNACRNSTVVHNALAGIRSLEDSFGLFVQLNRDIDPRVGNRRAFEESSKELEVLAEDFRDIIQLDGFYGDGFVDLTTPMSGYGSRMRQFLGGIALYSGIAFLLLVVAPVLLNSTDGIANIFDVMGWPVLAIAAVLIVWNGLFNRSFEKAVVARNNALDSRLEELREIDSIIRAGR